MTKSKEIKEPFSLKINFEINSENIKRLFKKIKGTIIIAGSGATIVHGTINMDFYSNILKKFGTFLMSIFN